MKRELIIFADYKNGIERLKRGFINRAAERKSEKERKRKEQRKAVSKICEQARQMLIDIQDRDIELDGKE